MAPLHAPTAAPSRTAQVLEVIKGAILSGDLPAGRPLVETDLARELGVSKTPVREALKTLEGTGLVVIRPYQGAAVREMTYQDAAAVYDMRLLLEPEAVRRTVAARGDLAEARGALERARQADDGVARSAANREFHRALYGGCGNPLLVATLDGLRDQTSLISVAAWAHRASWATEASEHDQILEAARAGRADDAAELVRRHVAAFLDRLPERGIAPVQVSPSR
jgi:DNA-binding GntR family transcriptional regulator